MSASRASRPSPRRPVQVIGAGLAGLAAAVRLAAEGRTVVLSDAASQAGGRCRSYFDPQLGATIDNGNHLVMSGNQAVMAYLGIIGAQKHLSGPEEAQFAFIDRTADERWTVRPNLGAIPWWIMAPNRRVPGTTAADYLRLAGLVQPRRGVRVDEAVRCEGPAWKRLMEPFLVAALNTRPEESSASLAAAVVRETLLRGGRAYRPRIAEPTLAAAFIDPALAFIRAKGGEVHLGRRLRTMEFDERRLSGLIFSDTDRVDCEADPVILAAPPWVAQTLVPGLTAPNEFRAIVNAHFLMTPPAGIAPMIGVIDGAVEWIFAFADRISVTISNADRLVDLDREGLAQRIWREVSEIHGLGPALPPWQIVKEKRATFAATPAQDKRRPPARTRWSNLVLAGDWTQTGLPATLEGAVRSGFLAADLSMHA